jgi:hypothetical protein
MLLPGIKGRRLEAKKICIILLLSLQLTTSIVNIHQKQEKNFFSIICFGGPREKQKP